MTCEHLNQLEQELLTRGFQETFRGQAWSDNCREWVYFRVCLDASAVRERFNFAPCVSYHEHLGTHDGQEAGFVCNEHHDGVMGYHPTQAHNVPVFP